MRKDIGLYRGKRKDNGEWVEGCAMIPLPRFGGETCIVVQDAPFHSFCYEVIHETVGEYTGLRDCKLTKEYPEGQMIFEGDIMETAVYGLKHHIGVVQFADGSFGLRCTDGNAFFLCFVANNFTIIGNIHDNPELLQNT